MKLIEIPQAIAEENRLFRKALRTTPEHAVCVGALLVEAKAQVGQGEWEKWIADNCEFSARSAQGYMMAAKRLPDLLDECERRWGMTPEKVFGFANGLAALRKLRDSGLYRETHATFTDYCRERWGWEEPQFAAKVVKILQMEIQPQYLPQAKEGTK